MNTLHRYIFKDFLTIFGMSMLVTTLVLYLGSVMKALDYISQGVPGTVLIKVFTLNIPYILTMSIPVSCLVACLLLFNRLSLDGEFTAMRSGGLSTMQIISPVLLCGCLLTLTCIWIHYQLAPESRFSLRKALSNVSEINPMDLLEEGRFVEFPSLAIWVNEKRDNHIDDVEIHERNEKGELLQIINARSGEIQNLPDRREMRVRLQQVQVQHGDPEDPKGFLNARVVDMEEYHFDLDYDDLIRKDELNRNIGDMQMGQLLTVIRGEDPYYSSLDPVKREKIRMRALVTTHKRLGLSLGCISFILLGIPLGMNRSRGESNSGIPIGLSMILVFYAFISAADSLRYSPWLLPDYL
ncbi:MAG: LptF/LptG family permease, partial [Kiritimatiellia bacterium]